jgi:FAD/FMN-containing dehydrogenase
MSRVDLRALAATVRGEILAPDTPGYDEARAVWNVRFDRRPDVIVRCRCAEDVQAAVSAARSHGMRLSVKGGGHAYAANTVGEGGLLIDLSPMKEIEIDPEARTARVGPGTRWGEVAAATEGHGLAAVGGTVSTVGVAGLTLGGGSGYLSRKHGMAVDNLLSAEVVTADGQRVNASATENPNLFWALRGGSGNFGVVTSFELRLHEIGPQILAGQIVHRFGDAGRMLRLYRDFMLGAPDDVQGYAFVLRVPPIPAFPEEFHGQLATDLVVFHPDPNAQEIFEPLLGVGQPILEYLQPQPFTALLASFDAGLPAGQRYESRSGQLTELSDGAIDAFVSGVGALPGAFTLSYIGPGGGGAIGRVDPAATAFPHRTAPFEYHILAGWTEATQDAEVTSWARGFHESMTAFCTGGVYVNLLGTDETHRVKAAYGDNYDRLVELKRKWDPENLFRMNHNISPD